MHVGGGERGFDPRLGPPAQGSKQDWSEDRDRHRRRRPPEAEPELLAQVVCVGGDPREPGRPERLKDRRGDSPQSVRYEDGYHHGQHGLRLWGAVREVSQLLPLGRELISVPYTSSWLLHEG